MKKRRRGRGEGRNKEKVGGWGRRREKERKGEEESVRAKRGCMCTLVKKYMCMEGVWCKYDGRASTHIIFVEDGYPDVSGQDLHTCGEREKGQASLLNKN